MPSARFWDSNELWTMLYVWTALNLLLQGACSFVIHNHNHSWCLRDSLENGSLQLEPCNLTSDLQRWLWEDGHVLVNVGTGRCLSGWRVKAILTTPCMVTVGKHDGVFLRWRCHGSRLTSHVGPLDMTSNGKVVTWVSRKVVNAPGLLGEGDVCSPKTRFNRASGDPDDVQAEDSGDDQRGASKGAMTEKQRAFLQWYYRTEDQSSWKYAMLAISFGALLLGSILLVMGLMANRNRKKIARYKAAALAVRMEELQRLARAEQANSILFHTDSPKEIQTPMEIPQDNQLNGKAHKDIQTFKDAATERPWLDDKAPQDITIPQEIQTPQDNEIPLEIQTPQEIKIPQEVQIPQDTAIPQEIQTPQGIKIPQEIQTPQDSGQTEVLRPADTVTKDTDGNMF
ncbi:uncharacterized protein LOC118781904 [Megalops cyprinoides]|uniref:uncharacterized protein LOC118781904 n=1 Tax=Megalops cyprinoides TaxID=118141 RepID=UPI0018649C73|nr:uncharacterized protein LOC118781904 [Megalops cyprinoides]